MTPTYERRLVDCAGRELAELPKFWGLAQESLVPGRRTWTESVLSDEQREAAQWEAAMDRHARHFHRPGLQPPGESAAPVDMRRLAQLQSSMFLLNDLCASLRGRLKLGPILTAQEVAARVRRSTLATADQPDHRDTPYEVITRPDGSRASMWLVGGRRVVDRHMAQRQLTEREVLFLAGRDWLAKSGLHGLHGTELEDASTVIRRAWCWLQTAAGLVPLTKPIKAPCPATYTDGAVCGRRDLRADVDSHSRAEWSITCGTCRSQWMFPVWDELGSLLGVDVFEAMGAAA